MVRGAFLYVLVLFMSASCVVSQESDHDDVALINETINMYFEGWMTGDTTKIGYAMHATCKLKNVKDENVLVFDRSTYLGFFSPRPRRKNAGARVVDLDITNNVAAAKCEIATADRLYTDYFNLMKLEDRWYIVDKIATNVAKEE